MDVLELQVLADLRRAGFRFRRFDLLTGLREVFGIPLYRAIGDGGPMALFIGGDKLYARTQQGAYNVDGPTEPLLMVGGAADQTPGRARTAAATRGFGRAVNPPPDLKMGSGVIFVAGGYRNDSRPHLFAAVPAFAAVVLVADHFLAPVLAHSGWRFISHCTTTAW